MQWGDCLYIKKKVKVKKSSNFGSFKYKSNMFIIFVFILFFLMKLSLFNCLGFIKVSDAKSIIKDFEKNYLYSRVFNNSEYIKQKDSLLKGRYTTKSKIESLIEWVKVIENDDCTEFKYIDVMHGKFNYSHYKKVNYKKKLLDSKTMYIRINSFDHGAENKFSKLIESSRNVDCLVLDLRGNCTGSYNEAIQIADDLLPYGLPIAEIEYSNSKHIYYSNHLHHKFKEIYILIDDNSGFCSQIISLALKENLKDKVMIIGDDSEGRDIGWICMSYDNKTSMRIASLKWSINGKDISDLNRHIVNKKDIITKSSEEGLCLAKIIKLISKNGI